MFDINNDGKVDYKDLVAAGTITAAAIGTTAISAAVAAKVGSLIVAGYATTIAVSTVAAGSAVIGGVAGTVFGAKTVLAAGIFISEYAGFTIIETVVVAGVTAKTVAAWSATTALLATGAEAVTGFIAGMPVIQTVALATASKAGEIIIIGGVAYSIHAAIAAGLVAAIIVAGVIYIVSLKG